MKVSLNSIKGLNTRYSTSGDITAIGIDKLIDKIGSQLGGIEAVQNIGDKYKGIVNVKVVSLTKHPDADKLNICKVDDNRITQDVERDEDGLVQVVCGAPNVRSGMMAVWLPPSTIVPETQDKEPLTITVREIRGVKSFGMLASPKELSIGDSHEGLLILSDDLKPGGDFAQDLELKDDNILDLENKMFTHRPDCFGFLGIARELAGIQGMPYKSPEWFKPKPELPEVEADLPLEVINELPSLVPRFVAITISDVKVTSSPAWLQVELAKVGMRSINNIVDLTNFLMLETAQPLHAYDYDKVKALCSSNVQLVIRNPKPDEKISLLNGKTIAPRPEAIMIATDRQAIGIGGVMGGSETEVDEHTKNIIIECANFDMYSIRRTSMEHGLFTDAVTRFTKGQSPLQNLAVMAKIVDEIKKVAEGKVACQVIDNNHIDEATLARNSIHPPIKVTSSFINDRLGITLPAENIQKLLENVEFEVDVNGEELEFKAPFWRTDIELREDIVEEVGRLYGYDELPLKLPVRDLAPVNKDKLLSSKAAIRNALSAAGANEVLTYSFIHGDLLSRVGQDSEKAFKVANALSPDLQYYRLSLMPSLLEKVQPNIKAGYDKFALFEIGKAHNVDQKDKEGVPKEFELIALVIAFADKLKTPGSAFYEAKKYLVTMCKGHELEFIAPDEEALKLDLTKPYEVNRSALVRIKDNGEALGMIGEFKATVARSLKLPKFCAGFELDTELLASVLSDEAAYKALPRFPKVIQDISLKVSIETPYARLKDLLAEELNKLKPASSLVDIHDLDVYQSQEDDQHKNITYRVTLASYDRTLTDTEVNDLLDQVAAILKDKLGAIRL
jgi:phenylalanyl-tRNA synthetase beta chain